MSNLKPQNKICDNDSDEQWKSIFRLGAISVVFMLAGTILDIAIGSSLGGNLANIPASAADRFAQFQKNTLIGLYNLDLLNLINQFIMVPAYFALFAVHRKSNCAYAALSLIIFLLGTAIFAACNTALPMLDLSMKYAAAATESQKMLLEAAGEAMLARGAHGSPGVLLGFLLPSIAGVIISFVMLRGRIFSKANAYFGIAGSLLMVFYVVLVAFIPKIQNAAMLFAMPGGLSLLTWMVMLCIKLFKLGAGKRTE